MLTPPHLSPTSPEGGLKEWGDRISNHDDPDELRSRGFVGFRSRGRVGRLRLEPPQPASSLKLACHHSFSFSHYTQPFACKPALTVLRLHRPETTHRLRQLIPQPIHSQDTLPRPPAPPQTSARPTQNPSAFHLQDVCSRRDCRPLFYPEHLPAEERAVGVSGVSICGSSASGALVSPLLGGQELTSFTFGHRSNDVQAKDRSFFKQSALGQSPKVLWIGCSDSR